MRSRVLIGALAAACVLAACSSSDEPGTAPPTEEQVLTVLLADDWASAPAVVDAIETFELEHPNVRVSVRGLSFGQLEEAIRTDLAGPREIDVSQWHAFAAGAAGYAQPVDDLFDAAFEDGYFIPGAIDDVSWGDHVYGVPLDVNALALLVNVTAIEEAGHTLDDLRDWDGVLSVAQALADNGVRFTAMSSSSWSTYGWVRANGGNLFDLDADGYPSFTIDAPAVVGAFDFISTLVADERYAFKPSANDVSRDAFTLFQDGETAALPTGSWDIAALVDRPPSFDWAVIPLPVGPDTDVAHTVLGGSSLYITEAADDRALAFELAAHLIAPENSLAYARNDGRLPPQVSVLADPFFDDPRYREVVEQLPFADAMRLIAFPAIVERYTDAISDVLNERLSGAEAMAEAQQAALELIDDDLARAESG